MVKLGNDWDKVLEKELSAEYFNNIIVGAGLCARRK